MDHSTLAGITSSFKQSKRRVIFLDYDGTLVDYNTTPRNAKPDDELLSILYSLAEYSTENPDSLPTSQNNSETPLTDVVISTGRGYELLTDYFDLEKISLITEHGLHTKRRGRQWDAASTFSDSWKTPVRALMQQCLELMPETNIEEKDYALVWHYRRAQKELCENQLAGLRRMLGAIVASRDDIEILEGKNVIEVKANGYNKGIAASHFIEGRSYDFIAAIGDDTSDESMFHLLPAYSITIRVGGAETGAKFKLQNCSEVRDLLTKLAMAAGGLQRESQRSTRPKFLPA